LAFAVTLGINASAIAANTPAADQATAILKAYQEERYYWAGQEALVFLSRKPPEVSDDLRLSIAHSLAWTGEYEEALRQYEMLNATGYTREALLGRANVYRWSGRHEQAVPLYERYLEQDPRHDEARNNYELSKRELQPRTRLWRSRQWDNTDAARSEWSVNHRYRSPDQKEIFEIEGVLDEEHRNELSLDQREITLRYENLKLPGKPWLEATLQTKPESDPFFLSRFRVQDNPTHVYLGHVNWGKLVFDPNALNDHLTANRAGADTSVITRIGQWRAAYDYYDIDDGNTVHEPRLRYVPAWQPISLPDQRFFFAVHGRFAKRADPRYWSPEDGYCSLDLGYEGEWLTLQHDAYFYVQRGTKLCGEGQDVWSGGGGYKYSIGDFSLGVQGRVSNSWRDDSTYRERQWIGTIEKRW
jgi:tetratricopeptide (TPR) repeat protein